MKILILSLAALTFVSGAFCAERVHTSSPTNSVKAKKLLEGQSGVDRMKGQEYVKENFGIDKSAKVTGKYDDVADKIKANRERRAAAAKQKLLESDANRKKAEELRKEALKLDQQASNGYEDSATLLSSDIEESSKNAISGADKPGGYNPGSLVEVH